MALKKEVNINNEENKGKNKSEKYIYIHESDYKKDILPVQGLTFSQILSMLGLLALLGAAWVDLSVKMERIDVKYGEKTEFLEKGRETNARAIELNRTENKQEHAKMLDKLDLLLERRKN